MYVRSFGVVQKAYITIKLKHTVTKLTSELNTATTIVPIHDKPGSTSLVRPGFVVRLLVKNSRENTVFNSNEVTVMEIKDSVLGIL